ncbi:UvrD-helicase domain-containing protein [Haloimpatiens lingqiaonensis]|uniref:UvrD-helicase domain-containing protein n=1 Tax=Haloimpatiens lingqiaonensis TaxID=1380675 RepID=UPI0010FD49A9|nr:UvrD-helicase domain-containing protein [Haloimpatiens lingqiaonensis]
MSLIDTEDRNFSMLINKLAKVWQNHVNYDYLRYINLSDEQIKVIEHEDEQMLINGYAGTGKSITLLYKFIDKVVRNNGKLRMLFVSYNNTLIEDIKKRLEESQEYIKNRDKHFIDILTFHQMAKKILITININQKSPTRITAKTEVWDRGDIYRRVAAIAYAYRDKKYDKYKCIPSEERLYVTHTDDFITDEIIWMKANGFIEKGKYLEVERTGRTRCIRLTRNQRNTIFKIFSEYEEQLKNKYHNTMDLHDYALEILKNMDFISDEIKYDYIFVDEVQDLEAMQIKVLANMVNKAIILSGDPRQSIYKRTPYSYEKLGLNIAKKGRTKVLNKNFRSTMEIIKLANSIEFMDMEIKKLSEKFFVYNGEKPVIVYKKSFKEQLDYVLNKIKQIFQKDSNENVAIIYRDDKNMSIQNKSQFKTYLEYSLKTSVLGVKDYGKKFKYNKSRQVFYTNIYDIKGLEFDNVFVIQFDKRHYPNDKEYEKLFQYKESEGVEKDALKEDIDEINNREKKLLYVAMTRAKKRLYMVYSGNLETAISPFVKDFDTRDFNAVGFRKTMV